MSKGQFKRLSTTALKGAIRDFTQELEVYAPFIKKGTEAAFSTNRGYNGFRGDAGDVAENMSDTVSAIWEGLQGNEVRTRPMPPRRPNGTPIMKDVCVADLTPCVCTERCFCTKGELSLQRYIFKVAFSLGDQYVRMQVPRDQRASQQKHKDAKERADAGLAPEDPLGTPTFKQKVTTKAKHPDAEPACDPRMAMSLRPGPELILAMTNKWPVERFVAVGEFWHSQALPVRDATTEEWAHRDTSYPQYATDQRTVGGFSSCFACNPNCECHAHDKYPEDSHARGLCGRNRPYQELNDADDEPTVDVTWGPELVTLGQYDVDLPNPELPEDEESTEDAA